MQYRQAGRVFLAIVLVAWTSGVAGLSPNKEQVVLSKAVFEQQCGAKHNLSNMELLLFADGSTGRTWVGISMFDCLTGEPMEDGCIYPKKSLLEHLYAFSPWIGAIKGGDTLVSLGLDGWGGVNNDFDNDLPLEQPFVYRSSSHYEERFRDSAVSEQDFIMIYSDTHTVAPGVWPPKDEPIGIEVTQSSYAWSYKYAEDFVLFNLDIANISGETLEKVYIGLYVDADIKLNIGGSPFDDICGFIRTAPSHTGCDFVDSVNLAWIADNNGDPFHGEYIDHVVWEVPPGGIMAVPYKSAPHIVGTSILKSPTENQDFAFNWWCPNTTVELDFGPMLRSTYRNFGEGRTGDPTGDANKYYVMSNHEFDYDQVLTARISGWDAAWVYPNQLIADDITDGYDTRYLISFGPFTMPPRTNLPLAFSWVAGENLHRDPAAFDNTMPDYPRAFYENLDFSDFTKNATWARWVYDNPGFDTDGDGYLGKYRVCHLDSVFSGGGWVYTEVDTQWYEGDGIPDWRAAIPPPIPPYKATPLLDAINVRFNGTFVENFRDPLTGLVDFEGYHVWIGRDDRPSSYSMVASFDKENYDKFVWDADYGNGEFLLEDEPFTIEELRCLYGLTPVPCSDENFDPLMYSRGHPYYHQQFSDSVFYFAPHNFNASSLQGERQIHKVYPEAELPPDNIHPDSVDEEFRQLYFTEDGLLKFYEYEYTIENLLSTVPYYVSVTAFDFGSPSNGLQPLETSVVENAVSLYPINEFAQISGKNLKAYVYPNPYVLEGGYRSHGYEGITHDDLPDEKVRSIHFNNLPIKCWIRIYSLDGDLIRELRHESDENDPNRYHARWDLVNRNRQMIVTGLYYWVVESDDGTVQMGKLAVVF